MLIKKLLKFIYTFTPTVFLRRFLLIGSGYVIGRSIYIPASLKISDQNKRRKNVKIGDRVSIGPNVTIITDSSPNNSILRRKFPIISEDVSIEEDAWIGANVTILPGVTIGKCSIIGAGSVVNKSIPQYSIAAGVPSRVIKQIDPDEL